ncbi:orotidine-5'-phosphate decarboxylase [Brachybacterium sp. JHP9]|uniref:Orotidine 5'-phosphate decarboxylase n=1 Tax=Brachybacterium equifaecis TaxID=2910770 RepID=A0ABT0R0L7_9MICO|nr:orotidine-5'-phosphate decarboxylase [Brachybacterium equifaecis]MCL6423416.1 orotidine-5'-phosphate decarboxylase [Brachybacterium equifaecis]
MSAAEAFGARLQRAVGERGPLVVGIDPHAGILRDWGLPDDADGVRSFSRTVVEACGEHVCAFKPQAAFFERHGSAGVAALEETLALLRDRGVLSILDAKRGDIGSTMDAYVESVLAPGAPLEADSITLSPYLGFGSLAPALERADAAGKGVFVLALTSNPEGREVQHARGADGRAIARAIAEHAAAANASAPAGEWGGAGLVIGATTGDAVQELGLDLAAVRGPLLAPGFGAQGAGPAERDAVFGDARGQVLVSISRQVVAAGPDPVALRTRVRELAQQYAL